MLTNYALSKFLQNETKILLSWRRTTFTHSRILWKKWTTGTL